ncbi:unnamed protein product [Dovyalis caffra]|uniref:EF-hand domain-containing protein n=1 Tax=Dovyalis caffra TaxID=77055 RepID=A0AAV1RWN8_9ROSI|nr:unnamed protein product [Dovyalis caffra]
MAGKSPYHHHQPVSLSTDPKLNSKIQIRKMVGPMYDLLANPLGAVRLTFDKSIWSGSDPSSFDGKDWGAVDLFRHFLFDQAQLSQVPILNGATINWIKPNTLVRFRGMIQDMLGNEFYVGAYKDGSVWRTNKFMDISECPVEINSPEMRLWERRLLCCVPVPGLNSWAKSTSEVAVNRCMDLTSDQRDKRRRMDIEAIDHNDFSVSVDGFEDSPSAKRMREDPSSSQYQDPKNEGACSSHIMVPDVDRDSLPCLVKIYDSPESELKLNDVFEFVGVLTFDSELPAEKDDNDEFSNGFCDDVSVNLPPNKVPRLHCVIHRKLAVSDFLQNSLLVEPKPHSVKEARKALLTHLTSILGNDGVAAHFMLLHLLSRVHARADNVAVGKLSLNLTCISKETACAFGAKLGILIKNLLPFTKSIPLTVEYLNTASLAPKKDYQINRLMPGVLQLAEGSHLIVDETRLETGTLNSVGVENARLLKALAELQKVEYDFKYYKMEMAADVQLLILSEGKSNIVPADIIIPFEPSSVGSSEAVPVEVLEAWRGYLAAVRSLPHSIESDMQKMVENDLVTARQADRSLGSQDFSRWLTMGRLISASFGETSLSLEHWQMVKELERLRRDRLKHIINEKGWKSLDIYNISVPATTKTNNYYSTGDHLQMVFDCFDEDGDGKISAAELRSCITSVGGQLSIEEAEAAVSSSDVDGDGLLGFQDFQSLMAGSSASEEEKAEELKQAFGRYETEPGSGCITPNSLKRMLSRLGESRSINDCKAMIRTFDLNGDGVLSFREFAVMMH